MAKWVLWIYGDHQNIQKGDAFKLQKTEMLLRDLLMGI